MSERWEDAHCDCARGLVRPWIRDGTVLGAPAALRASGAAVPFALERLSKHPANGPRPPWRPSRNFLCRWWTRTEVVVLGDRSGPCGDCCGGVVMLRWWRWTILVVLTAPRTSVTPPSLPCFLA